jgi:hypothetical protein
LDAADDSGRVGDHITNRTRNLTFRGNAGTGLSGGDNPATLLIDGNPVATDPQGTYVFDVNLRARATAYRLRVESDGLTSAARKVRVIR